MVNVTLLDVFADVSMFLQGLVELNHPLVYSYPYVEHAMLLCCVVN